jgi:DNA-binding Xre family transcriptional regulator
VQPGPSPAGLDPVVGGASTLSLIEGERRRVTLDDALALCRGLNIGLTDLLAGADTTDLRTMRLLL